MKIIIVGASGLVGGNCLQLFRQQPNWEVLGTHFSYPTADTVYYNTLDLEDPQNFSLVDEKPDVVIHCGALTWVDHCEEHPEKSKSQTVDSAQNLIEQCKKVGARFIYISTDYVFDGEDGPYSEHAKTHPLSVYGKHKWEVEQLVLNEIDNGLIIRITNVYGDEERGKNFVARLIKQSLANERVSLQLPIDQFATPINALDVARGLEILIRNGSTGIYHFGGTDYLNRYQLASRVLRYFPSKNITLQPILTSEMQQPARRPLRGGLLNEKFTLEHPDFVFTNVDDYLTEQLKKQ